MLAQRLTNAYIWAMHRLGYPSVFVAAQRADLIERMAATGAKWWVDAVRNKWPNKALATRVFDFDLLETTTRQAILQALQQPNCLGIINIETDYKPLGILAEAITSPNAPLVNAYPVKTRMEFNLLAGCIAVYDTQPAISRQLPPPMICWQPQPLG